MKISFSIRKLLGKNGASRILYEQLKRFSEAGHDVSLYCARCGVELPVGVKLKKYFSLSFDKDKRRDGFASGFGSFCRRNKTELAIGNGDTLYQDVLFMHNIVEMQDGHTNSRIFRLHDRIMTEKRFKLFVCNSLLMKDFYVERYGLDESLIRVVYPGYDIDRFNTLDKDAVRAQIRAKHGIDREFVLGFISSGDLALRGVDTLIASFAQMSSELLARCAVILIGKDKNIDGYRTVIEAKYPELKAYALGAVDDIQLYYKSVDVLLHPAKVETFGMTVLEARATGVPVIASRTCGVAEIFSAVEREILMDTPDAAKMAEYTEKLLTDRQFYRSVSEAAAESAKAYTWDNYFDTLIKAYKDMKLIP